MHKIIMGAKTAPSAGSIHSESHLTPFRPSGAEPQTLIEV